MPRIRSIKPDFWTDTKLRSLSNDDRLVFIALWSLADDEGRLIGDVRGIDAFIWPEESDQSSRPSLERLASLGRIERYVTDDGTKVIQIANWLRHQKIDHPRPSSLPCRAVLANKSRAVRSALAPDWSGVEGNGVEGEIERPVRASSISPIQEGTSEGRDGSAAVARAVTGPQPHKVITGRQLATDWQAATGLLNATTANGHTPATEDTLSQNRPDPDAPIIPRPPAVPEPPDPIASLAPNGADPFLESRRAAAAWVKAHPAEFAELQRIVAEENPHSEAAGGRKEFLSGLLLGRVTRILHGHDQPPTVPA